MFGGFFKDKNVNTCVTDKQLMLRLGIDKGVTWHWSVVETLLFLKVTAVKIK